MTYKKLLFTLAGQDGSSNPDAIKINVPTTADLYYVNLNTRTIDAPRYLSVQQEHMAETVYFLVDRYYDNVDLSQTTCIINFLAADGKGYVYYVPYCDVYTYYGKMILPWNITGAATRTAGKIQYFITFFRMEPKTITEEEENDELYKFTYRLNTLPATSEVLVGLDLHKIATADFDDQSYGFDDSFEQLHTLLASLQESIEDSVLYWIDVGPNANSSDDESTTDTSAPQDTSFVFD